jgi:hypothetical protein
VERGIRHASTPAWPELQRPQGRPADKVGRHEQGTSRLENCMQCVDLTTFKLAVVLHHLLTIYAPRWSSANSYCSSMFACHNFMATSTSQRLPMKSNLYCPILKSGSIFPMHAAPSFLLHSALNVACGVCNESTCSFEIPYNASKTQQPNLSVPNQLTALRAGSSSASGGATSSARTPLLQPVDHRICSCIYASPFATHAHHECCQYPLAESENGRSKLGETQAIRTQQLSLKPYQLQHWLHALCSGLVPCTTLSPPHACEDIISGSRTARVICVHPERSAAAAAAAAAACYLLKRRMVTHHLALTKHVCLESIQSQNSQAWWLVCL